MMAAPGMPWHGLGDPILFLDGARSHKRVLDKQKSASEANMNEMRQLLEEKKEAAAKEGILPVHWAAGPTLNKSGRISRVQLQGVYRKFLRSQPRKYAIRRQLGSNKYGGPAITVVFTPPYHPELQP